MIVPVVICFLRPASGFNDEGVIDARAQPSSGATPTTH